MRQTFNRKIIPPQPPEARSLARLIGALPATMKREQGIAWPEFQLPTMIRISARTSANALRARPGLNPRDHVLFINLAGPGTAVIDGAPVRLTPGQALLIFEKQFHHFTGVHPQRILWALISFQMDHYEHLLDLRQTPIRLTPPLWHLLTLILQDYVKPSHTAAYLQGRICTNLWQLLVELGAEQHSPLARRFSPALTPGHPLDAARKIIQYIHDHFQREIRIRDLARLAEISPSGLRRLFRRLFLKNPSRYVRTTRVNYAARLMIHSEWSLKQIAAASGFKSIYAFSRTFKQEIGCAPSVYRKRWADASNG